MYTPASKWIRETFEGGVTPQRVRTWVEKGIIPGTIIDGAPFVDADRAAILMDTHTVLSAKSEEKPRPGNNKIAQIVQAGLTR